MLFVAALLIAACLAGCTHGNRRDTSPQWLARHPDTDLRVLVWNVDRRFFEKNADIQRVLKAVDADLLILDEMPAGASAKLIESALPDGRRPWRSLYGVGGGMHQRASISARARVRGLPAFNGMPYPPERFDDWMSEIPERKRARVRDSLKAGVSAVGGIVKWQGRRILVVGLDLECCGDSADGPAEQRRQFEARAIRAAIDAVTARMRVDAILVGGDFNAVQGLAPIELLERGPSAKTTLTHPTPRHRGPDASDWTWDGRGTPFPSKQIDYLLHSPRLRVLQSQVFDTEDLAADQQQALQLEAELSKSLSPHRPIVVDLGWQH